MSVARARALTHAATIAASVATDVEMSVARKSFCHITFPKQPNTWHNRDQCYLKNRRLWRFFFLSIIYQLNTEIVRL